METKRVLAGLLTAAMMFSLAACADGAPSESSQVSEVSESQASQNPLDTDGPVSAEIESGTISYSHGCIARADKYPYWEAASLDHATGELKSMVEFDDAMYIEGDEEREAFLASDSQSFPSETHDLLYIYTMPYDAMVNIELTSRVHSENSNGIKVYCYANEASNPLVKETVVTSQEGVIVHGAYAIELKKGDKLYCGYNANGSSDEDGGNFYVKLTYITVNK